MFLGFLIYPRHIIVLIISIRLYIILDLLYEWKFRKITSEELPPLIILRDRTALRIVADE